MTSDELLTIGEVARLASRSIETIRAWERAGLIRALRDPRTRYRLIRKADVDGLVDAMSPKAE